MERTSDALNMLKCKSLYRQNDDYKNVIANPVLWDEAIYYRLLRRPNSGLLVMTWKL